MWLLMMGLPFLTSVTTATGFGHCGRLARFASNSRAGSGDSFLRIPSRRYRYRHGSILFISSVGPPRKPLAPVVLDPDEQNFFEMLKKVTDDGRRYGEEGTTLRVAGGWVRDKLLGFEGKNDIDITVNNMSGKEFVELFNRWLVKEGKEAFNFGVIKENPEKSKHLETVAINIGPFAVDFSNLRTENYCEGSRIPSILTGTPEEDAARRDLTINSLYFNINTGVVEDYTGCGINDLKDGLIRTPLPSLITLRDDPLRVLRAIRFACRFHFKIVEELLNAIADNEVMKSLNIKVSRERIRIELESMLEESSASRALGMMHKLGVFSSIVRTHPTVMSKGRIGCLKDKNWEIQTNSSYGIAKCMVVSELCRLIYNENRISTIVRIHGDDARLLRMAALISFLVDVSIMHPKKMNKTVALSQYVLTEDLKVNKRDKYTINTLIEAANDFRVPVRKKFNDVDGHRITRLELGKSVRKAGPNYQYALALAMASEILERTQYMLKLKDFSDLVNVIFSNFDCSCEYVAYDLDEKTGEFEHTVLSTLSEYTKMGNTCFVDLVEIIRKYDIEDSWALKPLLNGNFIKENFPDIPVKKLSCVMESQIDWMIDNPTGTETELCRYINEQYRDWTCRN